MEQIKAIGDHIPMETTSVTQKVSNLAQFSQHGLSQPVLFSDHDHDEIELMKCIFDDIHCKNSS
jgi:hypothetical protein